MVKIKFLTLALVILAGGVAAFGQGKFFPIKFPDPVLELTKKEAIQNNGEQWLRYTLRVKNSSSYTDALFKSSPELPACGQNSNASRTWLTIFEAGTNQRLNSFCAFNSASDLQSFWFAVKKSDAPDCFYVTLNDRKLNKNYTSKKVCSIVSVQPLKKADLKIEQFLFPPTFNKGLRVKVVNNGSATAGANKLRLTVRRINGNTVGRTLDVDVQSLTPGQSAWIVIQADSILPVNVALKDTTFKLNVDFSNVVTESNENNNEVWHNL